MGTRRQARELAMQALFSMDMSASFSKQALADYCQSFLQDKGGDSFFSRLVNGVLDHKDALDNVVERYSSNWKMRRMACVDRNVLRLAVFELLYCPDIPAKVSINEAIDIGKKFGSTESGAFINGILDSVRMAMDNRQLLPVDLPSNPDPTEALIND
ncbi:MAG: transcription antitermination factor NusB [Desulfosarcinaceae bacterium]|jgi:N utilization substance protein B